FGNAAWQFWKMIAFHRLDLPDTMYRSLPMIRIQHKMIALGLIRKLVFASLVCLGALSSTTAWGQSTSQGRYFPLDQTVPPVAAGRWSGVRQGFIPAMQFVRVELPGSAEDGPGDRIAGGQVAFYTNPQGENTVAAAPATVALRVG